MIWIGLALTLVFIGIAWRIRAVGQEPCPRCGHRKFEHEIFTLDGVVLGPYRCNRCGKNCAW
jgi:hypothetical protein